MTGEAQSGEREDARGDTAPQERRKPVLYFAIMSSFRDPQPLPRLWCKLWLDSKFRAGSATESLDISFPCSSQKVSK